MMKILIFLLFMLSFLRPVHATDLVKYGESAILMEASTGKVLYSKNEFEHLHPASMTKMMGMLLVYESIQKESIQWDDVVTVSSHAASMGGSQIFLEENETMTLKELFTAICVSSANDAMVAVAEFIGLSEENFVQMMNQKVVELGLENTHFSNATGLDADNHYSCAYDMAVIAKEVFVVSNEEVTQFTSLYETYLREDTDPFWLVNTNKLIRTYEGMDGLKTGFTQTAGYCLTASAKRDHMRLIAVVMKESNKENRNTDIKTMLDYGFSQYEQTMVYPKGTVMDTIYVSNGKPSNVDLKTTEDIRYFHKKGEERAEFQEKIQLLLLKAPLKVNDSVAQLLIEFPYGTYQGYLTVSEDILPLDYLDIFFRYFPQFLF